MLQVVVARTKTPPAGVFAVDQVTTTSKTKNDASELSTVVSKPAGCRDRKIENILYCWPENYRDRVPCWNFLWLNFDQFSVRFIN